MKVLNDFCCDHCGTQTEHFLDNNITTVECQDCGKIARKVLTAPKLQFPGNDPGFPTAYDAWAKKRAQKIAHETKADNA
jgi:predicted nucleic acid-binding Zn ribbon protein